MRHQGRVYLAWRSGALHFAGTEVTMYVVSSADEKTWTFETKIALGRDVREPSFLSLNGHLFLYFAVLGMDSTKFEPQGMKMVERTGPGAWTAPVDAYQPGIIPWTIHVYGGKPYMDAYIGGENIYNGEHDPIYLHWLTSSDGKQWAGVVPEQPVVHTGGCSESDFVFMPDGAVVAVLRNEAGDADGWGSKICRAEPGALGTWRCNTDRKKYDSPLVFRRGGNVYLIARRNLNDSGEYDLMMRDLSPADQTTAYLAAYSKERKRCSLWRVDPTALTVAYVTDLPGRGDTCFPRLLDDDQETDPAVVYNYTSSLDPGLGDLPWFAGQTRPTFIYRTEISGL